MPVATAALNALLYACHRRNTRKYRRWFGRRPNYLEPRLYSEKIQWRKLFDRNPLFPVFCDKLAVRAYVEKRAPNLRLSKILWSGGDAREIPYASLPDRYVIKPNHRSGCNYFVHSREDVRPHLISELSAGWLIHPEGWADE